MAGILKIKNAERFKSLKDDFNYLAQLQAIRDVIASNLFRLTAQKADGEEPNGLEYYWPENKENKPDWINPSWSLATNSAFMSEPFGKEFAYLAQCNFDPEKYLLSAANEALEKHPGVLTDEEIAEEVNWWIETYEL